MVVRVPPASPSLAIQIQELEKDMLKKEEHEGTLLHNLTSARNSMRSVLGKDSLLITRFVVLINSQADESGWFSIAWNIDASKYMHYTSTGILRQPYP